MYYKEYVDKNQMINCLCHWSAMITRRFGRCPNKMITDLNELLLSDGSSGRVSFQSDHFITFLLVWSETGSVTWSNLSRWLHKMDYFILLVKCCFALFHDCSELSSFSNKPSAQPCCSLSIIAINSHNGIQLCKWRKCGDLVFFVRLFFLNLSAQESV